MFIHHLFKTPQKKKSQTKNCNSSSEILQSSHQQSKHKQKINQLYKYAQFNTVNDTIDLDMTNNNFNLILYEKEDAKIKYDPQIMTAKLRRLQNQVQINRIQMELQQRRKKKGISQYKTPPNQYQSSTYKQTYEKFLNNGKLIDMPPNDSESEQDQIQLKPNGISRFHQLKKHSKILEHTLRKIKQKEQKVIQQKKQFQGRKQHLKNLTNNLEDFGQYTQIVKNKKRSTISVTSEYNPQVIVQDKFKRIMTMKTKDKVSDQVKQNSRCNKMINLQNDILLQLQHKEKSLSKQNMKKLKSRFTEVVNQLQKGDKGRKQNKFLPTIDLKPLTSRTIQNNKKNHQKDNFIKYLSNTSYVNRKKKARF